MKKIILVLMALELLWKPFDASFHSFWGERWGFVVVAIGWLWIWKTKLKAIFKTALSYFLLISVLNVFYSGWNPFDETTRVLFLSSAIMNHLVLMFCFLSFLSLKLDISKELKWCAILVLIGMGILKFPNLATLFIKNPSMAATFVVLASSVAPWSLLAPIFTHSYIAAVCFVAGTIWRLRKKWWSWSAIPLGLGAVWYHIDQTGYQLDNGRFVVWKLFFRNWILSGWHSPMVWNPIERHISFWFGLGPGTTKILLPLWGVMSATGDWAITFNWVHNDFLQMLGEFGVVGFILAMLSAIQLWRMSEERHHPELIAYACAMCANFPLHIALTGLIAWNLIGKILRSDQLLRR